MNDKVIISQRAFLARMKRSFARKGLRLKAARAGTMAYQNIGPYYALNDRNVVEHFRIEFAGLVDWAREDGTLKPFEDVA